MIGLNCKMLISCHFLRFLNLNRSTLTKSGIKVGLELELICIFFFNQLRPLTNKGRYKMLCFGDDVVQTFERG